MKKIMILCLGVLLSISSIGPIYAEDNMEVSRVSGYNRYNTSVELSKKYFKSSKRAIIASGEGYADALVGGTMASQVGIPIFLVQKNSVSKEVLDELKKLSVEELFILGGNNTISKDVELLLRKNISKVERIAGRDRESTADEIAMKRYNLLLEKYKVDTEKGDCLTIGDFYVGVDGTSFADALVAAPFVGQIEDNKMLYYMHLNMDRNTAQLANMMVFGGYNSIPKSEFEMYRYAGENRYQTAVEVAKAYKDFLKKDIDTIVLANGENYPDALASSPIASKSNAAILLTASNKLDKDTKKFIKKNKNIKEIIIVGGEKSVSKNVEKELRNIHKADKKIDEKVDEKKSNENIISLSNLLDVELNEKIKKNPDIYQVENYSWKNDFTERHLTGNWDCAEIFYKPAYEDCIKNNSEMGKGYLMGISASEINKDYSDSEVIKKESDGERGYWTGVRNKFLLKTSDNRRYLVVLAASTGVDVSEEFQDGIVMAYNKLIGEDGDINAIKSISCKNKGDKLIEIHVDM